jgi:hypothetical protein
LNFGTHFRIIDFLFFILHFVAGERCSDTGSFVDFDLDLDRLD